MSVFEDYETTSRNYDDYREPVGADVPAAMLPFFCGQPLKDLHILDAGCGTGNYAKALLDQGLGEIALLDGSNGMLERAKTKLGDYMKTGSVSHCSVTVMPNFPFHKSTFDGVMFNHVLHHLDRNSADFTEIKKTLTAVKNVLKPGGVVAISTVIPSYFVPKIWYHQLNQTLAHRYYERFPELDQWNEILETSGFCVEQALHYAHQMTDKMLEMELDAEGPSKKEWRNLNSMWGTATSTDIDEVCKRIQSMKREGILESFMRKHDKTDGRYHWTFIFASVK